MDNKHSKQTFKTDNSDNVFKTINNDTLDMAQIFQELKSNFLESYLVSVGTTSNTSLWKGQGRSN